MGQQLDRPLCSEQQHAAILGLGDQRVPGGQFLVDELQQVWKLFFFRCDGSWGKKRNRKKVTTLSERSTRTGKKVDFFYKIVLALSFLFHKISRPRCPKTPQNCPSAKSLSFEKLSSKPLSASLSVFFLLEGKKNFPNRSLSLLLSLFLSLTILSPPQAAPSSH